MVPAHTHVNTFCGYNFSQVRFKSRDIKPKFSIVYHLNSWHVQGQSTRKTCSSYMQATHN